MRRRGTLLLGLWAIVASTSLAHAQDVAGASGPLALPAGYGPTSSTDAPVDEESARVLDAWLDHYASDARGPRITAGGLTLAIGVGILPIEAWLLSTVDLRSSSSTGIVVLASVGMGLAILDIALGILRLAQPSLAEQRFDRWRAMRASGPVSARALGRFEGELRGELAQVQDARWTALALGIGLSVASALGLGLTAGLATDSYAQLMGYVISGALGLLGIVLAVVPWFFTQPEDDWHQLEEGHGPSVSAIVPWVDPYGGGLALSGTL